MIYNNYNTGGTSCTYTVSYSTDTSSGGWFEYDNDEVMRISKGEKKQMKTSPVPHETAKSGWVKELLQVKRIMEIKEGHMLIVAEGEERQKQILHGNDIAAFNYIGLKINGVYTASDLRGLNLYSQTLVIIMKAVGNLPDNFMTRANYIHEVMCMIPNNNRKAVIVVVEEVIDESSLRQLIYFAGGKNIEKIDLKLPGITLMASASE